MGSDGRKKYCDELAGIGESRALSYFEQNSDSVMLRHLVRLPAKESANRLPIQGEGVDFHAPGVSQKQRSISGVEPHPAAGRSYLGNIL